MYAVASVAVGDLCESVDEYLEEDFFNSNYTAVNYFLFCDGSEPYQNLSTEIYNLIRLANESLENATREGNSTVTPPTKNTSLALTITAQEKDYWTGILEDAELLQDDFNILLDCTTTATNYNQTKEDLCTDILYVSAQLVCAVLGPDQLN